MFAVLDAADPLGKSIAEKLSREGKRVRVVSDHPDRLKRLAGIPVEMWICEFTDEAAIQASLEGIDSVYLVLPPQAKYRNDFCDFLGRVVETYARGVARARVQYVVCQSSILAQSGTNNRLVNVLHEFEQRISQMPSVNVLQIRAGHFLEFLGMEIIPSLSVIVGALDPDIYLPIVVTEDVVRCAVRHLVARDFRGCEVLEVLGREELTMRQLAEIVGRILGKPKFNYVQLDQAAIEHILERAGLPRASTAVISQMWDLMNGRSLGVTHKRSRPHMNFSGIEEFLAGKMGPGRGETKAAPYISAGSMKECS